MTMQDNNLSDREILTVRTIAFPRERVFRAWTEADALASWWGPKGFRNTFQVFEPRPQGSWNLIMHGPDGTDYPNESVFLEVSAPERIVFDHLRPMHRFRAIIELEAHGTSTRIVWRMVHPSAEACDRVRAFVPAANEENLDRLEAYLNTH
jgi:uncharacterized protein YndB with AHSA1/START domain